MRSILAQVAQAHGLTPTAILSPTRLRAVSEARQEAMALMKKEGHSSTKIGLFLGGRDHTTILHGVKRHWERVSELGWIGDP